MKMIDRAKIESAANAIYSKYYQKGSPAKKLPKIITAEGIKLKEIDGDESFLGAFLKQPNGSLYIFVNQNTENIGRKNFTLAHELGHFILQHYLHTASFVCSKSEISEENKAELNQEKEANYFASYFLLPKEKIVNAFTALFKWRCSNEKVFLQVNIKKRSYSDWKAISSNLEKKFGVSNEALKIRLVDLGLINNF